MSHNRMPYYLTGQSGQISNEQPPPSTDYYAGYPPPSHMAVPPPHLNYQAPLVVPPCDLSVPPPGASLPYYASSTASHYPSDYSQSSSFIVPASTETLMPPPSVLRTSSYLDEIRRYEDWKRKFVDDRRDTSNYKEHRSLSVSSYDRRSPTRSSRDRSASVRSSRGSRNSRDDDRRNDHDKHQRVRKRSPSPRSGCRDTMDRHRQSGHKRNEDDKDRRESKRTVSPRSLRSLRESSRSRQSSYHIKSARESSLFSSSSSRSFSVRNSQSTRRSLLNEKSETAKNVQRRHSSTRIVETPARDKMEIKIENRDIKAESYHRSSRHREQPSPVHYDNDRHSQGSSHESLKTPEHSREELFMQRKSIFIVDSRSSRKRSPDRSSSRHDARENDKAKISSKDIIFEKSRKNFCKTSDEKKEEKEENQFPKENQSDEEDERKWYRSSPAELYYKRSETIVGLVDGSPKDVQLTEIVFKKLIERGRKERPEVEELPPSKVHKAKLCRHKLEKSDSTSDSNDNDYDDSKDEADRAMHELQRKQKHPRRLHPEMWFNTAGEMNDGPACRCSARTRRTGIRHSVYEGETIPNHCNPNSNNFDKLYHYRIIISPPTNFLIKNPTIIKHDDHEFLFSGFSMLSHYPLGELPECKVIRFNIEYTIIYEEDRTPLNFTIKELDLFQEFLFIEVLELVDLNLGIAEGEGCTQFHFIPRFIRNLPEGGCEVLSMCEVLKYLLSQSGLLVMDHELSVLHSMDQHAWQKIVYDIKGMIVTYPGKKPCSVRVDQLDRNPPEDYKDDTESGRSKYYPEIVHFGIRPPEISYAGNPGYQKALRYYVKYRHLVANMAKPSWEERRRLLEKGAHLQTLRTQSRMKRDVTVAVSSKGFHTTGLMCDVVQHAMLIPVLVCHLRFHNSLNSLEETLQYKFVNRRHLQLALTHPSYRENFGTNPDHARNSLTNCGIRQPKYGDRRIHYMNTRKRGINTLINIMSRFGKKRETESAISHNERLEFLGDAVVEFLTSIHLFKMFPGLEEGGLATYRAAIVQNQHLALLAKKLNLEKYMLYAHGSDLCHDLDLRHAMANCFEALIGALFLDGGIEVADKAFALALWHGDDDMLQTWTRERLHLLQEQEPLGDRKYIKDFEFLQKLAKFEESIGVYFKHIRLLARAFTDRSVGYTNLTLGSNQRLEFLGDTVLQLIVSDKLYRHFPEHHEGHLSLLRSSLVNNRTQSVVCDDLNMASYAVYHSPKAEPSTKGKADLLEAFLGALYLDKGIEYCTVFCGSVLFPRLQEFILNQDWNDPKSKLQQCCLTLRTMDGGEPDIPVYKVIECLGPTNTRVYTVAVYFRGNRLATASGHSIQEAEMNAAKNALACGKDLFPQLDHQKRVIAERVKSHRRVRNRRGVQKIKAHSGRVNGSKSKDTRKAGKSGKKDTNLNEICDNNLPRAYKLGKKADSDNNLSDVSEGGKVSDASEKTPFSRSSSDDDAENSEPVDNSNGQSSNAIVDKPADHDVICSLDERTASNADDVSINENNLDIRDNYLEPVVSEDEKGFEDIEMANLEDGEIPSDSSL